MRNLFSTHTGGRLYAADAAAGFNRPFTRVEQGSTAWTVATAPAASGYPGAVIYLSDGNAGSACLAWSDGTNWKIIALGATAHNP